jgi:peptidoglycan/LPS O-acetylase OafA/YrhL
MGVLRFILAIAVVLEHTANHNFHLMRGSEAVHVFFIISGFYMCMVIREKYTTSAKGIFYFYINRYLRLWPAYITVVLMCVAWFYFCRFATKGTNEEAPIFNSAVLLGDINVGLVWFANITLFGIDVLNWLVVNSNGFITLAKSGIVPQSTGDSLWLGYSKWVPQAWTIGSELWFYLCAPFLIIRWPKISLLIIFTASLIFKIYYSKNFMHSGYFIWFFWIWLFCLGMAAYLFYKKNADIIKISDQTQKIILAILLLIFTLPYVLGFRLHENALIFFSVFSIPILFHLTKKNKVDRFVGELSYPIYISHMLTAEISSTFINLLKINNSYLIIFNIGLCIFVSVCLVLFIDNPIETLRKKIAAASNKS